MQRSIDPQKYSAMNLSTSRGAQLPQVSRGETKDALHAWLSSQLNLVENAQTYPLNNGHPFHGLQGAENSAPRPQVENGLNGNLKPANNSRVRALDSAHLTHVETLTSQLRLNA